jgi:hypothetical protein
MYQEQLFGEKKPEVENLLTLSIPILSLLQWLTLCLFLSLAGFLSGSPRLGEGGNRVGT